MLYHRASVKRDTCTVLSCIPYFFCLITDLWASFKHPSPHKQSETFHGKLSWIGSGISPGVGGQLTPEIYSDETHGSLSALSQRTTKCAIMHSLIEQPQQIGACSEPCGYMPMFTAWSLWKWLARRGVLNSPDPRIYLGLLIDIFWASLGLEFTMFTLFTMFSAFLCVTLAHFVTFCNPNLKLIISLWRMWLNESISSL